MRNTTDLIFGGTSNQFLPKVITEGMEAFNTDNEKVVYALGSIITCSAIFPSVTARYNGDQVNANLYGFIVGGPSTGKSAVKYAQNLVQGIDDQIRKAFDFEGVAPVVNKDDKNNNWSKSLIIPGNTSSSALITALDTNRKGILVVETEADTLAEVLKRDFGGFSDVLRKGFHHEAVSQIRKTDKELIKALRPRLSILLAGTKNQVTNLIPSVSDGLYSRFVFLKLDPQGWETVTDGSHSKDSVIDPLAKKVMEYYHAAIESEFTFSISETHLVKLNEFGKNCVEDSQQYGEDASSIAFRHGLILFRIAMVLSILRHLEQGKQDEQSIVCEDQTFDLALHLTRYLFNQSLEIFQDLGKTGFESLKPKEAKFYENLPDQIKVPEDRNKVALQMGLTERTGLNYLRRLYEKGWIEFVKDDLFMKVAK